MNSHILKNEGFCFDLDIFSFFWEKQQHFSFEKLEPQNVIFTIFAYRKNKNIFKIVPIIFVSSD